MQYLQINYPGLMQIIKENLLSCDMQDLILFLSLFLGFSHMFY